MDTETDDLPAYQAMHAVIPITGGAVALPPGISWLSDTWRISRPLQAYGVGGNGRIHGGFRVSPGRTALQFDYSFISVDGLDSSRHFLSGVDLKSRILVHGSYTGSAGGNGIDQVFGAGAFVRKGDCYIQDPIAAPGHYYRAANAGNFGVAQPMWGPNPGDVVADNGITWVTEPFPTVRVGGAHYEVGDRVYAEADNRFLFICTVEGRRECPRDAAADGGRRQRRRCAADRQHIHGQRRHLADHACMRDLCQ